MNDRHDHLVTGIVAGAALLTLWLAGPAGNVALAAPKSKLPPIYDTKVDGSEQIAEALAVAKRENKRVLLQFGANWCIWCHRLHDLFGKDELIARKLLYEYVLVLIDVDEIDGNKHNRHIIKRYGNPLGRGIPALVVLEADGNRLTTQFTEPFEVGDHHDNAKVLAFLTKWQAKPASADAVLLAALAKAKPDGKNVFVYFAAPWCSWCKRMDGYLFTDKTAEVFSSAYLPVKVDVERMTGGSDLGAKYGWKTDVGLPFFVVLDANGKKLADANSKEGNVGFPAESFEIDHFMNVVRKTAGKLTPGQLAVLRDGFKQPKP